MKLLVYYNLNHHYYYTIYRQTLRVHEVGEINKFNHQLIQVIDFSYPKPKLNEKVADNLENIAKRLRYGKVKKFHNNTSNIIRHQWWLKK